MNAISTILGLGLLAGAGLLIFVVNQVFQNTSHSNTEYTYNYNYNYNYNYEYNTVCPICLAEVYDMCSLTKLKCGHKYHKKCLKALVEQEANNNKCALCRAPIDSQFLSRIL